MNRRPPAPPPSSPTTAQELRRLGRFLWRAIRLRCPECGVSPMFVPLARTRTLDDWARPLDGCPRCGYAYRREDGYFLLAVWGVHYFTVTGLGLVLGLALDALFPRLSLLGLFLAASVPTVLLAFAFVRHAKSIYLAIDHFFDPHVRGRSRPD